MSLVEFQPAYSPYFGPLSLSASIFPQAECFHHHKAAAAPGTY